MHKILILPNLAGEPTLVGLYAKNLQNEIPQNTNGIPSQEQTWNLVESHPITLPLSDGLVPLFMEFSKKGIAFDSLYFVRGPGSFMALKLIYLFAKTLEITQNIKLYATHAFHFNKNSPIKAYGNYYFVKTEDEKTLTSLNQDSQQILEEEAAQLGITLQRFHTLPQKTPFALPDILNLELFSHSLKPLYLLPPV